LSCGRVGGKDVFALVGEVVAGSVYSWSWHIGDCVMEVVPDLLNRLERGGLKTLALLFLWLLRWYCPMGLSSMAYWLTYRPGPGTILTVVCGKTGCGGRYFRLRRVGAGSIWETNCIGIRRTCLVLGLCRVLIKCNSWVRYPVWILMYLS
jgi:hypothetical protein